MWRAEGNRAILAHPSSFRRKRMSQVRSAHSLNFRPEKALLIALVAVINGAGVPFRLVVLLITSDNEGHRLRHETVIYYARRHD